MKRTSLLRRSRLRSRPRRVDYNHPGRKAWQEPQSGFCPVCRRPCWRLHRHHVLLEQIVRREGADVWALRNSMLICPDCHAAHHAASKKIPLKLVPEAAIAFAVDVLGEHRAARYFKDRYAYAF